jgi:hypothetical protein
MSDPIHPITPGPPAVSRAGRLPVQRLERITRERDRPSGDQRERKRREPPGAGELDSQRREDDDGHTPHVDVRA